MSQPEYSHACTIAFTVISKHPKGEDFTPEMLKEALLARIRSMSPEEWIEAVGAPFDTYKVPEGTE